MKFYQILLCLQNKKFFDHNQYTILEKYCQDVINQMKSIIKLWLKTSPYSNKIFGWTNSNLNILKKKIMIYI